MFRFTPNECTKRNMARFSRAGPAGKGSRDAPARHLRMVEAKRRHVELDEIEKILSTFTQKENKS